jgi:maltose/maltodextrin transport system substrate-binding protein
MDNRTGKPVSPNLMVPLDAIFYFDRLNSQYRLKDYEDAKNKALDWVMANPVKTFNWQGEFQDVAPRPPYENMGHHLANALAGYLFEHLKEHPERKALAEELLRFTEDQFVNWERQPLDKTWYNDPMPSSRWVTPCAQEQLGFWMPVNGSAVTFVDVYVKAYRATGKKLYLAKARDLANTVLVVQKMHKGEYPTFLVPPTSDGEFERRGSLWINCAQHVAAVLMELAKVK